MSIESALARGRAAAEALMVDACIIERSTGETTSGGVVTPTRDEIYEGKCRLQVRSTTQDGQGTTAGEAYQLVARIELQIPVSAPELLADDRVTMTAAALDPQLVGKVYTVRDVLAKTHLTSRRVTVLEVTS
jgi:hypothetical protein